MRSFPAHCLVFFLAVLPVSNSFAQSEETPAVRQQVLPREAREAIEEGLAFLADKQTDYGQIGKFFPLASTSLAGLAFLAGGSHYNRGAYGVEVRKCVNFVVRQWTPTGLFKWSGKGEEKSQMHSQGYALLFLAEVYGMIPPEDQAQMDLKGKINKSIELVLEAQTRHGGWGYHYRGEHGWGPDEASTTVCQIQALRACRNAGLMVERKSIDRAIEYVKRCAKEDGSFRYQVDVDHRSSYELTAAAVSTLNASGVYSSEELEKGLEYMKKALESKKKPAEAAENFYYYGNFYAAQALHQAGGDFWRVWYPRIAEDIVKRRESDGHWENPRGRFYATAMAVLALEVPLQYLPIFQR